MNKKVNDLGFGEDDPERVKKQAQDGNDSEESHNEIFKRGIDSSDDEGEEEHKRVPVKQQAPVKKEELDSDEEEDDEFSQGA